MCVKSSVKEPKVKLPYRSNWNESICDEATGDINLAVSYLIYIYIYIYYFIYVYLFNIIRYVYIYIWLCVYVLLYFIIYKYIYIYIYIFDLLAVSYIYIYISYVAAYITNWLYFVAWVFHCCCLYYISYLITSRIFFF